MVPGDEFTSLVVEYFCSSGDAIWNMTEEEFVKQTVDHLVRRSRIHRPVGSDRWLHHSRSARLPIVCYWIREAAGEDQGVHRPARESADHRPVRNVPVQQYRPLDRNWTAGREKYPRRASRSRPGQRRKGISRDQAGRRASSTASDNLRRRQNRICPAIDSRCECGTGRHRAATGRSHRDPQSVVVRIAAIGSGLGDVLPGGFCSSCLAIFLVKQTCDGRHLPAIFRSRRSRALCLRADSCDRLPGSRATGG